MRALLQLRKSRGQSVGIEDGAVPVEADVERQEVGLHPITHGGAVVFEMFSLHAVVRRAVVEVGPRLETILPEAKQYIVLLGFEYLDGQRPGNGQRLFEPRRHGRADRGAERHYTLARLQVDRPRGLADGNQPLIQADRVVGTVPLKRELPLGPVDHVGFEVELGGGEREVARLHAVVSLVVFGFDLEGAPELNLFPGRLDWPARYLAGHRRGRILRYLAGHRRGRILRYLAGHRRGRILRYLAGHTGGRPRGRLPALHRFFELTDSLSEVLVLRKDVLNHFLQRVELSRCGLLSLGGRPDQNAEHRRRDHAWGESPVLHSLCSPERLPQVSRSSREPAGFAVEPLAAMAGRVTMVLSGLPKWAQRMA